MAQGSTQNLLDPSIGNGMASPEQFPPVPGLEADSSVLEDGGPVDEEAIEQANLDVAISELNLAEGMEEEELRNIGNDVFDGFTTDLGSMEEWLSRYQDYLKLATMVVETRTFPWKNASNVKYPLLATASMQFAARAYQTLVPSPKIVKANVVGEDADGKKAMRAKRISRYMSFQMLEEMPEWEDHMDRLCLALPIIGNMFKKTYYEADGKCCSELVMPTDLVVNYSAKSLEKALRKTHILRLYHNDVLTKIRSGEWLDHDHMQGTDNGDDETRNEVNKKLLQEIQGISDTGESPDEDLVVYLEQHTYLDLDGDGYAEPVIITIKLSNKEVVGISPGFYADDIETNDAGEIIKIEPTQYFTNFIFIPNPLSGVYGIGLGHLLGPLNMAADSVLNQLIDAGTINNLQSGFIAKGVRGLSGNTPLAPGEWRPVQTMGDDLRKGIVPLPTKEPSLVLFQLLGMMIESGFTLGSVNDLMQGKNPGQNQPFSTTSAVLQQGLQLYSSIHKRIFRSLKKEYQKIFKLNSLFLDEEKYFTVLDPGPEESNAAKIGRMDFNINDYNVLPAGDPNQISSVERLEKAQGMFALLQMGLINPQVAAKRLLEAMEVDGIGELLTMPPPQPSFDQQIEQQRVELERQDRELAAVKIQYQAARDEANAMKTMAEAQALSQQGQLEQMKQQFQAMLEQAKLEFARQKHQMDMEMQGMKMQVEAAKTQQHLIKTAADIEAAKAGVGKGSNDDTGTKGKN